jgi:hypothetical protein
MVVVMLAFSVLRNFVPWRIVVRFAHILLAPLFGMVSTSGYFNARWVFLGGGCVVIRRDFTSLPDIQDILDPTFLHVFTRHSRYLGPDVPADFP